MVKETLLYGGLDGEPLEAMPRPDEMPLARPVRGDRNCRQFNLRADVMQKSIADLPDAEKAQVRWFYGWLQAADMPRSEMGRILKKANGGSYYSSDAVVQLLTGGRARRGENIQPLLEAIEKLRSVEELRQGQASSGFIRTRLHVEIEKRLQKALRRQKVLFIWGDSQIGKTWSLKQYKKEHNHGMTIYVEVPTGGSLAGFLAALAREFAVPVGSHNQQMLMETLIEAFDPNMMLLVDEAHRALKTVRCSNLGILDFLRLLWNRKRCGIAVAMTNEGRDSFLHGPHRKALEQLWRRRIAPLQLPAVTPDDDAEKFAEAYDLPPAPDTPMEVKVTYTTSGGRKATKTHTETPLLLQRKVLQAEGLGVWVTILQDAHDMAREQRRAMSWGAVIKAHAQMEADAEILD